MLIDICRFLHPVIGYPAVAFYGNRITLNNNVFSSLFFVASIEHCHLAHYTISFHTVLF